MSTDKHGLIIGVMMGVISMLVILSVLLLTGVIKEC